MAAEGPSGLHSGMAPDGDQIEQTPGEVHNHVPELDLKSKKAPTGARARSIKTPLQREALEAAFLINQFPAEEVRRALGDRIQLTENQVQVWFSHKRRKDKKSQQATAPAATPAVTNGMSGNSAVPVASPSEAPLASLLSANSTPAAAPSHIPIASLPSFSTYLEKPSASAQASQLPAATTIIPKPVAAVMASIASAAEPPAAPARLTQLPATVHVPHGQINGTAALLGHSLPVDLHSSAYQGPQAESIVRSQAQPVFRPEAHIPAQTQALSQAQRLSTAFPRQFLPNQYPPQSFMAAQQAARLAPGITVSNFQPSLPVQPSPSRPIASQAFTLAATPSSAAATPASWLAAQNSPIVSEAHLPSPAVRPASEAAYANDSHPQSMHEDSDAGTEEFETAHEDRVVHAEYRELVEQAKQWLPVPYRGDGPPLAFVFDDPPSTDGNDDADDAGGAVKRKRVMVDGYEMEEDGEDGMNFKKARLNPNQIRRPPSAVKGGKEDVERRAFREAERAQVLAKRVEQTMMKDKERMEREKKRVKEKLEREKKKDEVAQSKAAEKLRQFHEREAKKAAERAEKEKRAEERKRLQDEKRREKELLRALAAQERQATRLRQRDVNTGPKDDLDIEWEQLMEAHHQAGYGSGTEDQPDQGTDSWPVRPEFPPTSLNLVPAFAADLPQKQGSDILMVAAFLQSFSGLLGLSSVTVDNLLAAVVNGEQSQLLGQIHIALLRLLQMDLEEAHATGAIQGGGATNFMDRAIINCAHALEEAWAWGFDVDVWRAHLNTQTWPEVLRQYSIAMGLGQKRPNPGRQPRRKPKMGTEGEDIVKDEAGRVTLVAPARFGLGTVKGAAYKVLQDVGPEGLAIPEIARRIQEQGLRDLTTSKTPEASVAGALSRDVIFARVAPSTYALKANIALHKSGANAFKAEIKAEEVKTEGDQTEVKAEPAVQAAAQDNGVKAEARQHQHEEDDDTGSEGDSDEDEDYESKADAGESWLQHLKTHEYDDLSFEQRVNVLRTLVHLALDGPAVRASLEGRIEEAQRVRKQMWEEAKIEKRLRQQEAAEKAKKSAEDAQRALDAYNANTDSPARDPVPPAHTGETSSSATNAQQHQAESNAGASTSQSALQQQPPEDEMSAAAASKQRQQQRAETIRRADEVHAIRGEPLGLDRRHNRYWHLAAHQEAGAAADPSLGRILVESHQDGKWRLLGQAHQIEQLLSSLERKGAREGVLHSALVRHQSSIERGMPAYSFHMPPTLEEQTQQQRSRLDMEHHTCLWNLSLQALPYLHDQDPVTGLSPHKGEPSSVTKLRADMLRVEAALPLSAMKDAVWNSEVWQAAVQGAQSALQLRQALGQLELAVHEGFLWQSHVQPRQPLLVKRAWMPIGSSASVMVQQPTERALSATPVEPATPDSTSDYLTWLPATCSAVSLRLFAVDSAIIYRPGDQPGRETLQAYKYIQRPSSTPAPGSKNAELHEPRASLHTTSGAPVSQGGQAKHPLFPPFPQAVLQGPRQNFRLPVADFKQAVLDAQNGVKGPGSGGTGLKICLPTGKGSSVGHASNQKGQPHGAQNKPPGQSRSSMGNGKARSKKVGKVQSLQQQASADMELDELTARSNTATPGPSEVDVQSLGRSVEDSDDEPEISSEDEQQHNNSDVELSD